MDSGGMEVRPGKLPTFFLVANVPFHDDTIHMYMCMLASVN